MLHTEIEKIYYLYHQCLGKIETDTRKIEPNCLFFCLVGENFDGNEFADKAIELGARFVISSNKLKCNNETVFYVKDTVIALQELAKYHRNKLTIPLFAIGGSNGKTTTKELCYAVAKTQYKTYATPGNFNNHIGLPLTLLAINNSIEFAILEMGTNHPDEMHELIQIGLPSIGTVTNIGKEHLEGFGTIDAIVKEESELINFLILNKGKIIINNEDPWLKNMGKRIDSNNKLTYGFDRNCNVAAEIIETMPYAKFNLLVNNILMDSLTLKIGGNYNILNALAAITMGIVMNIDIKKSIDAIMHYEPANNRSQWLSIGTRKILLDAYNANPSSVELAINEFDKLQGEKLIILGDMFELGNHALNEHLNIIKLSNSLTNCKTLFCGRHFKEAAPKAENIFETKHELETKLKSMNLPSYILIKGSRGMKMEEILEIIPS